MHRGNLRGFEPSPLRHCISEIRCQRFESLLLPILHRAKHSRRADAVKRASPSARTPLLPPVARALLSLCFFPSYSSGRLPFGSCTVSLHTARSRSRRLTQSRVRESLYWALLFSMYSASPFAELFALHSMALYLKARARIPTSLPKCLR